VGIRINVLLLTKCEIVTGVATAERRFDGSWRLVTVPTVVVDPTKPFVEISMDWRNHAHANLLYDTVDDDIAVAIRAAIEGDGPAEAYAKVRLNLPQDSGWAVADTVVDSQNHRAIFSHHRTLERAAKDAYENRVIIHAEHLAADQAWVFGNVEYLVVLKNGKRSTLCG
jgi:hypothetical protein